MNLEIEYSELMILVLAIFGFVGIMRGWYKEGITSLAVVVLALLVWQPSIAEQIIGVVNQIIKLVVKFTKGGFSLDPEDFASQSVDTDWLLDPDGYQLYIVVMVVILIASYLIGDATFKDKLTPLGRLVGGILGLCNGYVILALVREYLTNHLRSNYSAQAVTGEMSMQLAEVPTDSFFAGYGIIFIFVILIGVIALLVAGDRLKLPLK